MTGTELLDPEDIVLIMVTGIEARHIIFARFKNHQYLILSVELAKVFTAFVIVQAQHIGVKPHLSAAQGRRAALFEREAVHLVFGDYVALRALAFDGKLGKINVKLHGFQPQLWFKGDFHHFSLAVGIG